MEFAIFAFDWLGKPVWMWLTFLSIVIALLVFDLGVLHRDNHEIELKESLLLSTMYIGLGLAFGGWLWWQLGAESGMNYLTGFVIEKTLALDNVFVIALIFSFFAVPRIYQHRVLFWGILGVIVLRAIIIGLGATLVSNFAWVRTTVAMERVRLPRQKETRREAGFPNIGDEAGVRPPWPSGGSRRSCRGSRWSTARVGRDR